MPALMAKAFKNLGFERAMYLLRKYDQGSMSDYDELLEKTVPPWYVSHDTCGPPSSPPVPFAQVFAVIFSTADDAGQQYRQVLRGRTETTPWLQRFADLGGAGTSRWVFAV